MESDTETGERQDRIVKALEDRSPRLAGMYRYALNELRSCPEPGCEVARVAMICHSMRELMLNLHTAMVDTHIPRPEPSSNSLLAKLPSLLAKHPELNLDLDQDLVPVPKKVAREFSLLVKTRVQEDGRNDGNFAALVTGGSDTKHPAIKQWKDAYRFFVKWAHLDRKDERGGSLPTDKELLASMRVVEDVVEVRTAAFFDNLHSVEDLLAEINASTEDDE
jgi:hypothetical protein